MAKTDIEIEDMAMELVYQHLNQSIEYSVVYEDDRCEDWSEEDQQRVYDQMTEVMRQVMKNFKDNIA